MQCVQKYCFFLLNMQICVHAFSFSSSLSLLKVPNICVKTAVDFTVAGAGNGGLLF